MTDTLVLDPTTGLRLVTHDAATLDGSANSNNNNNNTNTNGGVGDNGDQQQVHLRFLASPINRVDLMLLAGRYPVQPQYTQDGLPIPGFDGLGLVTQSTAPTLQAGDLVIPRGLGLGTWRREAVVPASALVKLPPTAAAATAHLPPVAGALLRSGALVAWLLLETVRRPPLRAGDHVIVSAGTSSVAHFLVQLARLKGVRVTLTVRDRDAAALAAVRARLLGLGAAAVLSESELAAAAAAAAASNNNNMSRPVLALDCVYGRTGQLLLDLLAPQGTFSLVGLLAGPRATVTVTTEHLFAKQITFQPFRGSEALKSMGEAKAEELIGHVASLLAEGILKAPDVTVVSWSSEGNDEPLEKRILDAVDKAKKDVVGTGKMVWGFN